MTGQRLAADCVRGEQVRVLHPHPIGRLVARIGGWFQSERVLSVPGLLLANRLNNFPSLVTARRVVAMGINEKGKESSQELLTSRLCIRARLRLVWLRLRSVRPSSRWSSGRVGLKSCFALQANRVAIGLLVLAGGVTCGASPVLPVVPGYHFGREIPVPGFWSYFFGIAVNTAVIIAIFWTAWVVSGDRNKKD
jgi:hypothetical protein